RRSRRLTRPSRPARRRAGTRTLRARRACATGTGTPGRTRRRADGRPADRRDRRHGGRSAACRLRALRLEQGLDTSHARLGAYLGLIGGLATLVGGLVLAGGARAGALLRPPPGAGQSPRPGW